MKNLIIDVSRSVYSRTEFPYGTFPMPWGQFQVEDATVRGSFPASRGGAWYYYAPEECVVGYGRYCPYLEFRFSGLVEVSHVRDFEANRREDGWFGGRVGDRKWIYLKGEVTPSDLYSAEKRVTEMVAHCDINSSKMTQGHLEINELVLSWERYEQVMRVAEEELFTLRGRRKILNHQFFGRCRIFCISRGSDPLKWVIFAKERTQVVSPDHLDEPLSVEAGIWVATHPYPESGVD